MVALYGGAHARKGEGRGEAVGSVSLCPPLDFAILKAGLPLGLPLWGSPP